MPQPLLNSFKHFCFHTPRANVHQHPDLYRCDKGDAHATLMNSKSIHVLGHSDPPKRIPAQAPAVFPVGYVHPPDVIVPGVDCPACNDLATALAKDAAPCTASIHIDMAKQAGLVDDQGNVSCPICGGSTTLKPGEKKAEIHAKLCTDETIHYPAMRKAGTLSEADYAAWKATLSREELLGYYQRVPDIHVMAKLTEDEWALKDTDLTAFNALLTTRLHEAAENALLHQVPYRHKTTATPITL